MVTVSALFGIGLSLRCGISERLELFRSRFRREQAGESGDIDAEAACVGELRHQTEIGNRRRIAKTKWPGLMRDQLLASREPFAVGPRRPVRDLFFRKTEFAEG